MTFVGLVWMPALSAVRKTKLALKRKCIVSDSKWLCWLCSCFNCRLVGLLEYIGLKVASGLIYESAEDSNFFRGINHNLKRSKSNVAQVLGRAQSWCQAYYNDKITICMWKNTACGQQSLWPAEPAKLLRVKSRSRSPFGLAYCFRSWATAGLPRFLRILYRK